MDNTDGKWTRIGVIYGLHAGDGVIRYVGKTTQDPPKARLYEHRTAANGGATPPVYDWIREVGPANVQLQVLERTPILAVLDRKEREWIDKFPGLLNKTRLFTEAEVRDIRSGRLSIEDWARTYGYNPTTVSGVYWGYSYRQFSLEKGPLPLAPVDYPLRKTNTTGWRNVVKAGNRWRGQIMVGGKNHTTDLYDDPEDAHRAAQELRTVLLTGRVR